MTIYPAILTENLTEAQEKVNLAAQIEQTPVVHFDVMDGFFVDNVTLTPLDLVELNFGELKFDMHLMVDEPMDFVYEATAIKHQLPIRAVIAQIEHMSYQKSYIEEVRQQGWKTGLSLAIETPLDEIDGDVWEYLDVIQLMGGELGYVGRPMSPLLIPKLQQLTTFLKKFGHTTEVIIDVGVKPDNIAGLVAAGATGVAVNSGIWEGNQPELKVDELLKNAERESE